jgi:signal transduction histidine kinase
MEDQRKPAILIVEDERIVAMDLQEMVNRMGFDAFAIAGSAAEALAVSEQVRPDVALMDIRIDGELDGIQTASLLRERFDMPIVYLTAHADRAIVEQAKLTEPHGYLIKPVMEDELRTALTIAVYKGRAGAARARIAELESERRALLEAARLKSEFLANMAHELRTPLNGVIGFAKLMHDGMAGPVADEHRKFLHHVFTSGHRFLRVVNDMLDLSQMEAGNREIVPGAVDLSQIFLELVESLRPALEEKHQHLGVELDPGCVHLTTDPVLLRQLAYNYLSNAIKFTPREGVLTLRARPIDSDVFRLEVSDTGIGIDEKHLESIFASFTQVDSSTHRNFEGAGLGLALAKRIAELLGGRVGVASVPGGGSTFFAELPRHFQAAAPNRGASA